MGLKLESPLSLSDYKHLSLSWEQTITSQEDKMDTGAPAEGRKALGTR